MKISTVLIATLWAVIGSIVLLVTLISSPFALDETTWAGFSWCFGWGIFCLAGACCIFARRAVGWWMIAVVNGHAIILWTYRLFKIWNIPVKQEQDFPPLLITVVLALSILFVALLQDRPSKWRKLASNNKVDVQVSVDK